MKANTSLSLMPKNKMTSENYFLNLLLSNISIIKKKFELNRRYNLVFAILSMLVVILNEEKIYVGHTTRMIFEVLNFVIHTTGENLKNLITKILFKEGIRVTKYGDE